MRVLMLLMWLPQLYGQGSPKLNPVVARMVGEVSRERIAETMGKLASFGTRGNFSAVDDEGHGIGAARRWLYAQFAAASPRLKVRLDTYKVKKQPRVFKDVEIVNVVAVLPGTRYPEQQILVSGHYDTLGRLPRPPVKPGEAPRPLTLEEEEKRAAAPAPGVSDDGSGVAAVLELARVLSQYEFEKTLVFVAFAGEELGLVGSRLYSQRAKAEKQEIEAVLNNDIIGTEVSEDGRRINRAVRIFSAGPGDSVSRQLAGYVREVGGRYYPRMEPWLIYRPDRFGRGGDHSPFAAQGYAAVRFTSAVENYAHQHSDSDTLENASPEYTANVARLEAAVAASLAMAPKPVDPTVTRTAGGRTVRLPDIGRGKASYDTVLGWKDPEPAPDLAGYAVVMRATTAPYWEREIFVGRETSYTMEGVDMDNYVFGVKAIDVEGNESVVSVFVAPAGDSNYKRKVETYE
ncbi:MAG: M20/M25/M40 family metallo-hydrolase [Bryobacterales bacterium]|nr:M20/M25/M40 family metallo-hydrolase [Bryobacterales bacterium]